MKKYKIQFYTPLFFGIIFTYLIWLDTQSMFFGKFINYFFPCVQNELDSALCFVGFDFLFFIFSLGIIAGCFFAISFFVFKKYLSKSK